MTTPEYIKLHMDLWAYWVGYLVIFLCATAALLRFIAILINLCFLSFRRLRGFAWTLYCYRTHADEFAQWQRAKTPGDYENTERLKRGEL